MFDRRFLDTSLTVQGIITGDDNSSGIWLNNTEAQGDKIVYSNLVIGNQYLVKNNGSIFEYSSLYGKDNYIAQFKGITNNEPNWKLIPPKLGGLEVLNIDTGEILKYNGTTWEVKITITPTKPILGIVQTGTALPVHANVGDIFINTETQQIYTAPSVDNWGTGRSIPDKARYASINDYKIYESNNGVLTSLSIAEGELFLNKVDDCAYAYDGSTFICVSVSSSSIYKPVAPVLDIVISGTDLPLTCSVGDKFLDISTADLYTATANNTWNSGNPTNLGERYASITTLKIYESDGSELVAYDVPEGDIFLNKADNCAYIYNGLNFIKINVPSTSLTAFNEVEIHTLTAAEATAKSFTLQNNVSSGLENKVLLFVAGLLQIAGTDFTASGNIISWNGKGLESRTVNEGDTFVIHYIKA